MKLEIVKTYIMLLEADRHVPYQKNTQFPMKPPKATKFPALQSHQVFLIHNQENSQNLPIQKPATYNYLRKRSQGIS